MREREKRQRENSLKKKNNKIEKEKIRERTERDILPIKQGGVSGNRNSNVGYTTFTLAQRLYYVIM